jgi:hypothetical protein
VSRLTRGTEIPGERLGSPFPHGNGVHVNQQCRPHGFMPSAARVRVVLGGPSRSKKPPKPIGGTMAPKAKETEKGVRTSRGEVLRCARSALGLRAALPVARSRWRAPPRPSQSNLPPSSSPRIRTSPASTTLASRCTRPSASWSRIRSMRASPSRRCPTLRYLCRSSTAPSSIR